MTRLADLGLFCLMAGSLFMMAMHLLAAFISSVSHDQVEANDREVFALLWAMMAVIAIGLSK